MEEHGISISPDDRERAAILGALRKAAAENGGKPPGEKEFKAASGVSASAWKGKHWIRWSDLIRDAGYEGLGRQVKRADEMLLMRLAEIVRHFGKIPTGQEMYFYARRHPGVPSYSTFTNRFDGHRMMFERLRRWAAEKPEMADVVQLCQNGLEVPLRPPGSSAVVYLLRAGEYFKIGWAKTLEKRIQEIQSCSPERLELIHTLPTRDPLTTEAQWHHRFSGKRVRGEWFKLTPEDIAEFRTHPDEPA